MIITVTPNPSIDRTIALPGPLERGAVQRVDSVLSQPGGKGVNISRACVAAGVDTVAVLPAAADDPMVAELSATGVVCQPVAPAGPMRVNLTITEPDGVTTKLNAAGAAVGPHDLDALVDAALSGPRGAWVVLAGSLPPGADPQWYVGATARLRAAGMRVAVDTSGDALDAVIAALAPGEGPDLLKPNAEELAGATGAAVSDVHEDAGTAAAAARTLLDRGAGAVLATLGGAGAVLVDATGAWHAVPPPTTVVSTVGAGDASLFGHLVADLRGADGPGRLASAVAHGSAAAGLPGTTAPTPADVRTDLVGVAALDLSTAH
ncbi:1-phosphofructokinase family hexose kinase [Nocardioides panacisoli]|uniref:1-phosphofructokinase family hexose kinase n=1 Tax=Nocardioides panacisoli TaxID=627624 RepID=UPI001C638273|nr:1-phosphofructokinase family hexose kinase [Nocardioides panacisoli]QYJ05652.1 1-phosphofructokinase family hexose kinase [Nocardioides panacisoli]